MPSIRSTWDQLWRSETLEIEVLHPIGEALNILRAGTTAPFGELGANMISMADTDTIRELRTSGVYFQGRIHSDKLNVWCIAPGDSGRNSILRPHFSGFLSETGGKTLLEGVIEIPLLLKVFCVVEFLFSLTFVCIGAATGVFVLAIVGLGFFLVFWFFLILNVSSAASQWSDIARDLRSLLRSDDGLSPA